MFIAPTVHPTTNRTSDRRDVPALVRSLRGKHRPDRSALGVTEDEPFVEEARVGRSMLYHVVTSD